MGSIDEHTVAEAARAARLPVPSRFLLETESTNEDVVAMAAAGAPEWTFLVAGYQSKGRGRLGRKWVSPPDLSLFVSVLLRPDIPPDLAPALALGNAVCVAEACRAEGGVEVRTKWPNDLVVGPRKIGGILPEASVTGGRLDWVVLGTGVNVRHRLSDFPDDLRSAATSVSIEGGRPDIGRLLRGYLDRLRAAYRDGRGFEPGTLARYREISDTVGRPVRATAVDGGVIEGKAVGVGESGELIVRTDGQLHRVAFGEVEHLR
jgi:BirA family biotin operon repressor/biotin-[acetyl-CoA-carboxylase] ligase